MIKQSEVCFGLLDPKQKALYNLHTVESTSVILTLVYLLPTGGSLSLMSSNDVILYFMETIAALSAAEFSAAVFLRFSLSGSN